MFSSIEGKFIDEMNTRDTKISSEVRGFKFSEKLFQQGFTITTI